MNLFKVLKQVNDIFVYVFEDNDIVITYDSTSDDIKEWDSQTNIEIIIEIEKYFNIKFKPEELQNFTHIGEICECILVKL